MTVYRKGDIDGFETLHKMPSVNLIWNNARTWTPHLEKNEGQLFLLKCQDTDSDGDTQTYYHVCIWLHDEFRTVNDRRVINPFNYTRCYWASLAEE